MYPPHKASPEKAEFCGPRNSITTALHYGKYQWVLKKFAGGHICLIQVVLCSSYSTFSIRKTLKEVLFPVFV